ncbi:MAG TPA: hypothetical protein EYP33_01165 [Pyrodictium sp.]|nr:hypothetical protein [Pyrodictium sp.]
MRVDVDREGLVSVYEDAYIDIAEAMRQELMKLLDERRHWVTGDLALSFRYEEPRLQGRSLLAGEFYSDDIASMTLEEGTRPHRVPWSVIRQWAWMKFAPVEGPEYALRVAGIAYRRIRESGNKPHPYIDDVINRVLPE